MIRAFAEKVETLLVVEELDPFIEDQIRAMGIAVKGKEDLSALRGIESRIWPKKGLTGTDASAAQRTGARDFRLGLPSCVPDARIGGFFPFSAN